MLKVDLKSEVSVMRYVFFFFFFFFFELFSVCGLYGSDR